MPVFPCALILNVYHANPQPHTPCLLRLIHLLPPTLPIMSPQRYRLTLQYAGTKYQGWMKQSNTRNTIQQHLERATARLMGFPDEDSMNERLQDWKANWVENEGSGEEGKERLMNLGTIFGSSRTDAGVHALHCTCHVDLMRIPKMTRMMGNLHLPHHNDDTNGRQQQQQKEPIFDEQTVVEGMNFHLNKMDQSTNIVVVDARRVPMSYHARYWATERTYIYRMVLTNPPVASAFLRDFAWFPRIKNSKSSFETTFDLDSMKRATEILIGHHDFSSFCTITPFNRDKGFNRTLDELSFETIDWLQRSKDNGIASSWFGGGNVELSPFTMPLASYASMPHAYCHEIRIKLRAKSFLHHQCRFLVATLLKIARGHMSLAELERALYGREKNLINKMAPSCGLYLVNIQDELDFQLSQEKEKSSEKGTSSERVHISQDIATM